VLNDGAEVPVGRVHVDMVRDELAVS